jgi:hypothetical protein
VFSQPSFRSNVCIRAALFVRHAIFRVGIHLKTASDTCTSSFLLKKQASHTAGLKYTSLSLDSNTYDRTYKNLPLDSQLQANE